jgi:hypothetical protein
MKFLWILAALALAWSGLAAAAPRDCGALKTFPPRSMGVQISGGIMGRSDVYVVDMADGHVCIVRHGKTESTSNLTPAQVSSLKAAFREAGFFKWNEHYEPKTGTVADGMTIRIVYDDGHTRHSVTRSDPTPGPAGFSILRRRLELLGYKAYWHLPSFMYVSGRLEHSALEGGFWQVVYATGPDAAKDQYGGKLVLEVDQKLLAGFKSGDLVFLTGALDLDRAGIQMAGPHYRVKKIEHLR